MGWMSGALAVVCLAVGVFHLARLAVRRRDVDSEAAHGVMGLGMAAMFSPLGDPVPGPVWTAVFLLSAAWFGAALLRTRAFGGDAAHHVVSSGAMLFMLVAGHAAPAADGGAHAGHAAPGSGATGVLGFASVVALGLTAYFTWHALRCAERCRRSSTPAEQDAPSAADGAAVLRAPVASLTAPQVAAVAHLLMAASMAVMLLGMV
jgi:hypothetical protein